MLAGAWSLLVGCVQLSGNPPVAALHCRGTTSVIRARARSKISYIDNVVSILALRSVTLYSGRNMGIHRVSRGVCIAVVMSCAGRLHGPSSRRTASGPWRRATTRTRATAPLDQITPANVGDARSSRSRFRPASSAATRPRRSSSATRCTSSTPYPEHRSTRSTSRKPGAPLKWTFEPQARRRRRRASRAATSSTAARRTPTARSSTTRSTTTPSRVDADDRQGGLAHEARRHQPRRDDDDGAARRRRARCSSATAAASSACAAGSPRSTPTTGKDRLARLQHRARQGRADRRRLQAVLRAGPAARISA